MKKIGDRILKDKKGITLVALVITIIILIILAGVTINILFGQEGIIEKAKEASFKSRFRQVEEAIQTYKLNKEADSILAEILASNVDNLPVANKLQSSEIDGLQETLKAEIQSISGTDDITTLNLYYIDRNKIKAKREYIINSDTMQLYDVKGEKYFGKRHHTLNGEGQEETQKESPEIEDEPKITIYEDIGWYSPNMNGFNKYSTYMEYYNENDLTDIKEITVTEYIQNGKQSKIVEEDKTYVLDSYKNKIWANIKTTGNGLEAWWVWVPRYAYKLEDKNMDVIFVDLNNKPIGTKYTELPEGYELHPAFVPSGDDGSKNLQGIWLSKYESSNTDVTKQEERGNGCYAPDLTGFNKNNTYIELYDKTTNTFTSQVLLKDANLNTINNNNEWYSYKDKVWANIKTTGSGLEAWWVWVPRYAYYVNEASKEIEIIFIDLNNKPFEAEKYGDKLPENFIVHPAFTPSGEDGSKNLKGIWMSKYESSNVTVTDQSQFAYKCYAPDMTGFNPNCTYIELYDKSTNTFTSEVLLKDANLDTINNNNTWYSYPNKVWANIKTTGNGLEAWWVWIPRYAYSINEATKEIEIIFIDLENKPMEKELYGDILPENFIVHPAFMPSGEDGSKNLKGIWMSKYESSNKVVTEQKSRNNLCYEPDLTGFNKDYTYIELYDVSNSAFNKEILLSDADLTKVNEEEKWYSYKNKVWANIKTIGNGLEAWWVWIPRYAYYVNDASKEVEIIFIDLDNKPFDKELYGDTLPENFTVHPAFTPSGEDGSKNLKGIWMSKYESSNVADVISGTAPTGSASLPYASDKEGKNHTHQGSGAGTKLRYVTSSTKWCNAYDGTPCSNSGYYIYCSQCGVRLRHYWCANHYDPTTKVMIDDENVE